MRDDTIAECCGQLLAEHKAAECPNEVTIEDLSDPAGADFLDEFHERDVAANAAFHESTRGLRPEHVIARVGDVLRAHAEVGSVAERTIALSRPGYATARNAWGAR